MLGDVLQGGRPRSWVAEEWDLAAPWIIRAGRNSAAFYCLRHGFCGLEVDRGPTGVSLGPGDMIVAFPGREHCLRDQRNNAVASENLFDLPDPESRRRITLTGSGPSTRLVCGCLEFDAQRISPLLASLPPFIHIRAVEGQAISPLDETLRLLVGASDPKWPGSEIVVDHLVQVVFIQAIRYWLTSSSEEGGNWFRALKDPDVLRALHLMHAKIDAPWTVAALADRVCLSRSAFATRFKTLVSKPPLQYLLECRMRRACELLADGRQGIKEIAVQVGYTTAPAFSNAFKRWSGTTPGVYRRSLVLSGGSR